MPFTCAICSLDINVGEPMLSDEKMNLAHQSCIDRLLKDPAHPSVSIPSVHVSPLPPPAPSPSPQDKSVEIARSVDFRMRHGIPVPLDEARKMYGDSCVPSAPSLCMECQKPAIGMCPSCRAYVHQCYGYNGPDCSGRHESHCEGARKSRDLEKPTEKSQIVELPIESVRRNGKAVPSPSKNGRSRTERKSR